MAVAIDGETFQDVYVAPVQAREQVLLILALSWPPVRPGLRGWVDGYSASDAEPAVGGK